MIPIIKIGNDFNLTLTVKRSDGQNEDFTNVSNIQVLFIDNGAKWVRIENFSFNYSTEGILNVSVPANQKLYEGEYRAQVKYIKDGSRYLAENCQAFVLTDKCEVTTDTVESLDLTLDVQFSSDGKDGLSAYELAVVNGEYTGDYSGYQKWLAGLSSNELLQLSVNIEAESIGDGTFDTNSAYNKLVFRCEGYVDDISQCELRFMRRLKRKDTKAEKNTRHGWGVVRTGDGSYSSIFYTQRLQTLERTVASCYAEELTFGRIEEDGGGQYIIYRTGYSKSSKRSVYLNENFRVDINNYGMAVFKGDKMISNIAEFGITIINQYSKEKQIYIKTAYFTLGRGGAKHNIRNNIEFPI